MPANGDLLGWGLGRGGLSRQFEMRGDEALEPFERIRLLGVIERQNLGRRGFGCRVGERLAVGKDPSKLDVRVEVAEQNLRRGRPLERQRRIGEQEKRRDNRHAEGHDAPRAKRQIWIAHPHAGRRRTVHAVGGSVAPGPSERCIMIESVQRPNL